MCNSAEQSGEDHASNLKKDNGFTSESHLLFIHATNSNSSVGDIINGTPVQSTSAKAAKEAAIDIYEGAQDLERQANMQQADETQADSRSVVGSAGESECQFRGPCIDLKQEHDVSRIVQEANSSNEQSSEDPRESATWIEERENATDEETSCIAAGSHVAESKATRTGEAAMIETVEIANELAPKSLKEAYQDSSITKEQKNSNVPSSPPLAHDSNMKGVNGPELAEFFSNARGPKHEVEIEEQDHAPSRIRLAPKRKSYKESPRSLRMLLFSDETLPFAKKEEKHKRDGKSIEFSNRVVPASEGIVNEGHNEDITFPKWHESGDTMEAWSAFSGPLAFSGALTYQGMISYTGAVAYSGSISHRSDSSTSTRSFAFPILASDWNTSPVKMGAPDPRFFRQQRKRHFCLCWRRPSTLFD